MRLLSSLLLVLVAIAACLLSTTVATAPEATGKFFVSSEGVIFAQKIVDEIIITDIHNMQIPDETLSLPLGAKLQLSSIKLQNVQFNDHNATFIAPNQLQLQITDIAGELDLDWHYKGVILHFGGSATNKFSGTSINAAFAFAADDTGRPMITLANLGVSIGSLDVHISGGGSWLWNVIIDILKPWLRKIVAGKIQKAASADFQAVTAKIQQAYPLVMPLPSVPKMLENINLNLPLVADSAAFDVAGEYLVMRMDAYFSSTENSTTDPRPHTYIPDSLPPSPSGTAPAFGIAFDEAFLGSLLFSLTQNGVFNLHLTNADLPPTAPIKLNTAFIQSIYPSLYKAYPNKDLALDIKQFGDQPPVASTTTTGTTFSSSGEMSMSVVDGNTTIAADVCNVHFNYSLSMQFAMIDNTTNTMYFTGEISPLIFNTVVISANPAPPVYFAGDISNMLTGITNAILVPMIDGILKNGIALPTKVPSMPFLLSNLFIAYEQSTLAVGFDLEMASADGKKADKKMQRALRQQAASALFDFE